MEATTAQPTATVTISAADARLVGEILGEYASEITRGDDSGYARMLSNAARRVGNELHSAGWDAVR
jgi:hypothetical protein